MAQNYFRQALFRKKKRLSFIFNSICVDFVVFESKMKIKVVFVEISLFLSKQSLPEVILRPYTKN
jgi:hypothetical protein